MTLKISPFINTDKLPNDGENLKSAILSGYRFAVKDVIDIAGIETTAGNPDWLKTHPIPTVTAPIVQVFLENGAQYIGKTHTDELGMSLYGRNHHYGTPLNPKFPDLIPGGSSSGSASAIAANSVILQ